MIRYIDNDSGKEIGSIILANRDEMTPINIGDKFTIVLGDPYKKDAWVVTDVVKHMKVVDSELVIYAIDVFCS